MKTSIFNWSNYPSNGKQTYRRSHTFYSCKQSEELVICQPPSLNSSTHMIINKRKNLNLDINTTDNICTNLIWGTFTWSFLPWKRKNYYYCCCCCVCVCILAVVIWHASKCAALYCHVFWCFADCASQYIYLSN